MAPLARTVAENPAKRAAILDEAIRAFAELGFRGADVQVIADRAGVGKGTVYRYFGSKQDLFWATTLEVTERLEASLLKAVAKADGPVNQLRATCYAYAEFFQANPGYLEVIVHDRAEFRGSAPETHVEYHRKLIDRFAGIVQEGVDRGEIRPVDVRQAICAFGNLLYGTVVRDCYSAVDTSLTDMTQFGVEILLRGLRVDPNADAEQEAV